MKTFVKRVLMNLIQGSSRPAPRRPQRVQLGVEHLETRLMPAITDLTGLAAQLVPTPDHPTHLYLNFDGYQDDTHTVAAYNSSAQTVNEVLYRVSEIFSPFNVTVSRIYGVGTFDDAHGSSTIFIGDDTANNTYSFYGTVLQNISYSHTDGQYSDSPGASLGDRHAPHSNPYNLAFVDPTAVTTTLTFTLPQTTDLDPTQISQAIAHEAGHTFGLGHVLSSTNTLTFTLPQTTNDIMSYDSPNEYFADATFNLTDLNNTGTNGVVNDPNVVPTYDGTPLQTQNSFTYLQQVLGARPDDGLSHVVHSSSVDPSHYTAPATDLTGFAVRNGTIGSAGDYVVYWMKPNGDGPNEHVDVTPTGAGGLIPNLLVYENGKLLQYNDSYWNADTQQQEIHTTVSLKAGQTYAFVVGGANADSTGDYHLLTSPSFESDTLQDPSSSHAAWTFPVHDTVGSAVWGTSYDASGDNAALLVPVDGFLPAPIPATTFAALADGDPVALTAAHFSSLGNAPYFEASAQGADFQGALADIAVAQTPAHISSQVLPGDAVWNALATDPSLLTRHSLV